MEVWGWGELVDHLFPPGATPVLGNYRSINFLAFSMLKDCDPVDSMCF